MEPQEINELWREFKRRHTQKAREALQRKWEDEVDPDRVLPQEWRDKLAKEAQRRHLIRASMLAKEARRARKP
jgi:hypothetical protein